MDLAELAERIESSGAVAFLVTAGEGGAPHVVSVVPEWREGELAAAAGARTRGNAAASGTASLLWPTAGDGDYCLIVDGAAREDGERVCLRPTRAVLHRLASADAALPSCVTVL